jgi:hypothetical protein
MNSKAMTTFETRSYRRFNNPERFLKASCFCVVS